MIQTINSNTSSGTELIFARHETFYPRYGWLKKGFEAVHANSNIFLEEDAHIQLGVGKKHHNLGDYYYVKMVTIPF